MRCPDMKCQASLTLGSSEALQDPGVGWMISGDVDVDESERLNPNSKTLTVIENQHRMQDVNVVWLHVHEKLKK